MCLEVIRFALFLSSFVNLNRLVSQILTFSYILPFKIWDYKSTIRAVQHEGFFETKGKLLNNDINLSTLNAEYLCFDIKLSIYSSIDLLSSVFKLSLYFSAILT